MRAEKNLPDSCFVVLAILSEGESHGYELERLVFNRGFRFWTQLGRSSIYNSLGMLEKTGWVKSRLMAGGGPSRKMFFITPAGLKRLKQEGLEHLESPSHWRSEIDLGLYSLPLLSTAEFRLAFIEKRLNWCQEREMELPRKPKMKQRIRSFNIRSC